MQFDYIIIGAGLAGITAAEELANVMNKKVLLIEKENYVGGICSDYINDNNTYIHKHGPHIFHTNNTQVFNYLSLFTSWNSYSHKLLFKSENTLVPVPFNFISIDKLLPDYAEEIKVALLNEYDVNTTIPIKDLKQSENKYIREAGEAFYTLYTKHLKNIYSVSDEEAEEFIDKIPPFRTSYDCRYYDDVYQVVPRYGYTNMFNNMIQNHNITVLLNKDYKDVIKIDHENMKIYYEDEEFEGHLIFTGLIDEFFNYKYGQLPYQSATFLEERIDKSTFLDNAVIYYPEEYHFNRIVDYKHLSGEFKESTTIQFEYPEKYTPNSEENNVPYYPVDLEKNKRIFRKYKELSKKYNNITFIGRLTEYDNIGMDEVIEQALNVISEKFIE